jgi:hypothetical protein
MAFGWISIVANSWKIGKQEKLVLFILWLYHLGFSLYFHSYILDNGGDSIRYWNITADLSQKANTWMEHFGFSTFFIQWLNYLPAKILGIDFFTGNLIYGLLSYIGISLVALRIWDYSEKFTFSKWAKFVLILPLFFPNLHFWTAGVGKESVLWLGMALVFFSLGSLNKNWVLALLGVLICTLVRPVYGLLLLLPFGIIPFRSKKISLLGKAVSGSLIGLAGYLVLEKVIRMSHLSDFSQEGLNQYRKGQYEFLSRYGAGSELPMESYSWAERLWAVLFRPFWGEVWDLNSLVLAFENSISLLLILLLVLSIRYATGAQARRDIYTILRKGKENSPAELVWFSIVAIGMMFIIAVSANNMGLMVRLKSVWMPFLQMTGLWLICGKILGSRGGPEAQIKN